MKGLDYTREELIQLCKDAVVPCEIWGDRDSYSAQRQLQSIYEGLTAGLDFLVVDEVFDPIYHSDEDTLIIKFLEPIDLKKLKTGLHLEIDSRDDYFQKVDPNYETEMFDGNGIDWDSGYFYKAYMPTRKRLDEANGTDWY